jgi:hypothetical protein
VRIARALGIGAAGALLAPAASFGAVTIGSNLTAGGTLTNACTSQACSFAQVAPLPAADTAPGGLTSPSDGVVTRWRIKSGSAGGAVQLRVLRPTGGGAFTAVGTSGTETTVAGTAPFNTRLPIRAGDYLGVDNASDALIFAPTPGASIYRWIPPITDGSNRAATDTRGTLELMVQADVEPDVDCDGFGDETQDTNTADGPCAPKPPGATAPDTTAPKISALRKSPRRPRARKRMTVGYRLSEDATVTATIERCTKFRGKRCRRWRLAGTGKQSGKASAANRFRFKPRSRGRYRATLVATDAAKNVSSPKRISFRVRPRR